MPDKKRYKLEQVPRDRPVGDCCAGCAMHVDSMCRNVGLKVRGPSCVRSGLWYIFKEVPKSN